MPTTVTKLRNREGDDSPFGAEVIRQFQVIGPTDEYAALSAIDSTTGLAVPQRSIFGGDVLPENTYLRVFTRNVVWADYAAQLGDVWTVRITYRAPTFDIVAESVEWLWDQQVINRAVSSDLDGNPFLNTAGDPLIGTHNREIMSPVLRFFFNGTFDITLAYQIVSRVNSDDLTLFSGTPGAKTVPADSMRCLYYKPMGPQRSTDQTVRMEVAFDFMDGYKPWQLHASNAGFNGWYTEAAVTKKGRFYHGIKGPDAVEDAILLGISGIPLNPTSYSVGSTFKTPVVTPASQLPTGPAGERPSWAETRAVTGGFEMIFNDRLKYDFRGVLPPYI